MKTAARMYLTGLLGAGVLLAGPTVAQVLGDAASSVGLMAQEQARVQAQGAQLEAATQAQIQSQAQMQAQSGVPVLPAMPSAAPVQTATAAKVAASPASAIALPAGTTTPPPPALQDSEDEESSLIKVPKSVNNVLKKLDKATESVTLDDINAARDAIAKLDVLLDIEKRLSDLASIRHEREEKTMAAALPASALGTGVSAPPPPSNYPAASGGSPPMTAPPPVMSFSSDPEVARIVGADGRFVASIKEVDGKTLRVREGDKLIDGSVVTSISRKGLTIERDKNTRTIRVKDSGSFVGAQ